MATDTASAALTYDQVIAAWNAQADEHNQWDALGEDEKIEWAVACAKAAQAEPAAQGDASWPQLRSALALAMLGWGGRQDQDRTIDTCYTVLDAITEPGMPLALLRTAPDWRYAARSQVKEGRPT